VPKTNHTDPDTGFSSAGCYQNFTRAVTHGPLDYQGLNLPNLFTEELILHITTLVKFGNHPHNQTGYLLWANCKLLRLETGMRGPLFQILPHFEACVTPTWVSQCWLHCVQWGIDITMDIYDFHIQWEWDKELMRVFTEQGYRATDLAMLNKCRLYLQVIFVSDICNASGTGIKYGS